MYIHKYCTGSSASPPENKIRSHVIKRKLSSEELPKSLYKLQKTAQYIPSKEIEENLYNTEYDISKLEREIEKFDKSNGFLFKKNLENITVNLITIFSKYNEKYKNIKSSKEYEGNLERIISARDNLIKSINKKMENPNLFPYHENDLNEAKKCLEENITGAINNPQNNLYHNLYNNLNNFNGEYNHIITELNIKKTSIEIEKNLEIISDPRNKNLAIISDINNENNAPNIISEIKNILNKDTKRYTNTDKNSFLSELKDCLKLTNCICQIANLEEKINKIDSIIDEAYNTLFFDENQIKSDLENIQNIVNTQIKTLNDDNDNVNLIELFEGLNEQINFSNEHFKNLQYLKYSRENST